MCFAAANRTGASAGLLTLTIVLQSGSLLALKLASFQTGAPALALVGLACLCLVGRAAVWQGVLGRMPLSKAYPFTSLVQVVVFLYAVLLFGEAVAWHHVIGLVLMFAGLALLWTRS